MFWLEAIKNCCNVFCDLFFPALVFVESCADMQSSTDQSSQNTKKQQNYFGLLLRPGKINAIGLNDWKFEIVYRCHCNTIRPLISDTHKGGLVLIYVAS